jgi:hypothetical protein
MKDIIILYARIRCERHGRRGADKSWPFLFAAQPKEFFLDGLKKLEQQRHKRVELRRGICRVNTFFFNHLACGFLYKAKDL